MSKHTCPVCNELIPERQGRGRPRRYCSPKCGRWAGRHLNAKACTVAGCDKPHRAKGLCGSHYNQTHAPDRHKKAPTPCTVCGEVAMKYPTSTRRPVCSDRCRYALTYGRYRHEGRELVGPVDTPLPLRSTEAPCTTVATSGRVFVAGDCTWCGEAFCTPSTTGAARYCSARCAGRYARHRRSLKTGRFRPSLTLRRRVYERDGYVCLICNEPTDRHSHYLSDWHPSLDHVTPRSKGGADDEDNLRTAHRWCNAVINDGRYYTAADLLPA